MVTAHPPLRRPLIWRVLISLLVPLLIVALRPPGMLPLREARGAPDAPLNAPWLSSVPVSAPVAGPATAQDVPALAANAGSIYAIWQDDRNGETDIYFAGSADYGSTWDNPSPVNRDIGTGNHSDPDIAVGPGGVLHAVWTGATDGINRVTYVRSTDEGATWSLPITIGDVASAGQLKPAVSASASKVCVAWSDDRNGTYDVWLDCSADGITWGTDSRANSDTVGVRDHLDPDVAVAPGGDVHVTWADSRAGDDDIYAAFYHPATGWSANKRVNHDAAGATQNSPQVVAATDNDITIAWLDGRSGSAVYANLSLDGGISWSEGDDQVSDDAQAGTPSLAFDGIDTVWAAWGSGSAAPYSVMADRDSGAGWGVDMTANSNSEQPSGVALAASGDTAYAAWSRPKTEPDIWLSVWDGNTWDTAQQISAEGGARQVQPRLAAGSTGILYASWLDYRTSTGQPDLYVSASGDGGAHWNSGAKANGAFPVDPPTGHALAVTGGFTVHCIWSVSGDGLYYTRSSDMGASWSTPLLLVEGEITGLNLIADPFGALYLAWTDALGLMVAGSLDGGGTWSGPKLLAEAPAGGSLGRPVTAYDGAGELHVAWEQQAAGEEQGICAAHTIEGQELWEAAICFGSGALAQTSPAVAADLGGARVAVAWAEGGGIYVAVSDEGGAAWAAPVLASGDHPGRTAPALAVQAGGDTTIAWHDPSGGSDDAYAAHLAEGGAVWSAPERINDDATSWPQRDVSLAAIGDSVYAAWADFRSADWDIYTGALPAPCQSSLNSVDISGPWSVETGQNAIFSAVIDPSGATAPVRYGWAPAPSAGQYAATATYRFATTGSQQVHVQAMNCGSTVTAQRTVTVLADTTAPAWSGFSPTGWTTAKTPTVTIITQDTGTGLDVATGLYAYSTDGGVTWSAWVSATVSGASGTTEVQTITAAAVPFEQDSLTVHRNQIMFSVTDIAGNTAESSAYNVEIDATRPLNPTSLTGGTPGIWRNSPYESMKWSGASDASSGVAGYSYQWSEDAATVPDMTIDTTADSHYATIPADGTSWYFHVRAADHAGNWAAAGTTAHIGPYWLDTVAPEAVDVTYSDPPLGNTTDTTLYVEYTGTDNPGGSGLAGFSYTWSHDPTTAPSPVTNTVESAITSNPLADGIYYFHIRAVDLAGNSDKITHYGPWLVDTTQPAPPYILSTNPPVSTWSQATSVSVVWEAPSDPSGIAGYSLAWDHQTSTVPDTTVDTTATSITSPLAEGEWWFHVRAVDSNGTWGFTRHSGPFRLDRTLPSFAMTALPSYVGAYTFTVSWSGSDALSGLQLLTVQVRDGAGAWIGLSSGLQTALDFVGERGHTYGFRGYATDRAGNVTPWSAETSTRVGRDITIRVVNESAQLRNGAVVYRSGSQLGATDASGQIVASATLIGDRFSALYLVGTTGPFYVHITSVPIAGPDGVPQLYTINDLAVSPQVLTVRRDQPLFGAHLRVSVQWDANEAFLNDLRQGLINASNYLYDAGDGQFFIQRFDLMDAGSGWDQAGLRICTDTQEWPHAYAWDYISVGRFWDGNTGFQGNWSEPDGYRTLIHEFGHFALGLYDEYEDRDGDKGYGAHCAETRSSRPEALRSSIMDYQYDATEFCSDAEAYHAHYYLTEQDYENDGESCWQTMKRYYSDSTSPARWTLTSPDDRHAILGGPDSIPEPAWVTVNLANHSRGVCEPFVIRVLNDDGSPRMQADLDLETPEGDSMDEGVTGITGELVILGARPNDKVVLDCGLFCSAEWTVPNPCPAPVALVGQSAALARDSAAVELTVQQKLFEMMIGVTPLGAGQVRVEVSPTTTLSAPPLVVLQQENATPITPTMALSGTRYIGTATLDALAVPWGHVRALATSSGGQSTSWAQFRIDSGSPDQRLELMSGDDQFEINLLAGALTQATEVGVEAGTMPAAAPGDLVPLSDAYRIRLSSGQTALAVSCQVRLHYDPGYLEQMDLTSVAIYRWDTATGRWLSLGGALDPDYSMVYTRTTSLGPFALFGRLGSQSRVYLPIVLR